MKLLQAQHVADNLLKQRGMLLEEYKAKMRTRAEYQQQLRQLMNQESEADDILLAGPSSLPQSDRFDFDGAIDGSGDEEGSD